VRPVSITKVSHHSDSKPRPHSEAVEGLAHLRRIAYTNVGACFVRPGSDLFAVTGIDAGNGKPVVIRLPEKDTHDIYCLAHRPKLDIKAETPQELREKVLDLAIGMVEHRTVYQQAEAVITIEIADQKQAKFSYLLKKALEAQGISDPNLQIVKIMQIIKEVDPSIEERICRQTIQHWLDGSVHCTKSRSRLEKLAKALNIPEFKDEFFDAWLIWSHYRSASCAWLMRLANKAKKIGETEVDIIDAIKKEKKIKRLVKLTDFADFKLDIITHMKEGLHEITKEIAALHVKKVDDLVPKADAQTAKKHRSVVSRGLVMDNAPESVEVLTLHEIYEHLRCFPLIQKEDDSRLDALFAKLDNIPSIASCFVFPRNSQNQTSYVFLYVPKDGVWEAITLPILSYKLPLDVFLDDFLKPLIDRVKPDEESAISFVVNILNLEYIERQKQLETFDRLKEAVSNLNSQLHAFKERTEYRKEKRLRLDLKRQIGSTYKDIFTRSKTIRIENFIDFSVRAIRERKFLALSWEVARDFKEELTLYDNEFDYLQASMEFRKWLTARIAKIRKNIDTLGGQEGHIHEKSIALRNLLGPEVKIMSEEDIDQTLTFYGFQDLKQYVTSVNYLWSRPLLDAR